MHFTAIPTRIQVTITTAPVFALEVVGVEQPEQPLEEEVLTRSTGYHVRTIFWWVGLYLFW